MYFLMEGFDILRVSQLMELTSLEIEIHTRLHFQWICVSQMMRFCYDLETK